MPEEYAKPKAARKRAEQTPPVVRAAMLAGPVECQGITLYPLSLDILWTLEHCGHPAMDPLATAATTISSLQIAQLIFIFAHPSEAAALAAQSRDDGLSALDAAALAFIRRAVPVAALGALVAQITRMITEGLATAPGGANPKPAATA